MDGLLVAISYYTTLVLLCLVFVFTLVYIFARGICAYRKVSQTQTREEFELLSEAEILKKQPVHKDLT